jgi:hypothetical protein
MSWQYFPEHPKNSANAAVTVAAMTRVGFTATKFKICRGDVLAAPPPTSRYQLSCRAEPAGS